MSYCTCSYLPHAEWCAASTEHAAEILKLKEEHRFETQHMRARLDDCYAALVGYSEGEPGEVLRRLIAQHAIDAAEIARGDIERAKLRATLAQPHMEWAAGQHSVGVDIAAEDRRLRARLALVEPVLAKARQWRLYPRAPGAIAELERAIDLAATKEQG